MAEQGSRFGRFLADTGHRVVRTASGEWFDAGPRFLLNLPFHRPIRPDAAELREALRAGRGLGARYTTTPESPGRESYQIVCDARPYGLERLSANTRSKIRRGLKRCRVTRITAADVRAHGWPAHLDTLRRQRRLGKDPSVVRERWERYWSAVERAEDVETWGAWAGDRLAAYMLAVPVEDRVEILVARSRDDCLSAYPNNALLFTLTDDLLDRPAVTEITFGLESLEDVGPLDQFKLAMGYRHRPIRQRVVFHPVVQGVVRWAPARGVLLQWAQRRGRHSVFWRKVQGLLRFAEAEHAPERSGVVRSV